MYIIQLRIADGYEYGIEFTRANSNAERLVTAAIINRIGGIAC